MKCNYKISSRSGVRCGLDTEDGAKMCPGHQKKMREYMRTYREKSQGRKEIERDIKETIEGLVDRLVEGRVSSKKDSTPGFNYVEIPEGEPNEAQVLALDIWVKEASELYDRITEHYKKVVAYQKEWRLVN